MGFNTVAIARGSDKGQLAKDLSARHYIDSQAEDPAAALVKLGGARIILAAVTNGDAMSATMPGLGHDGKLMILGAPESLQVNPFLLVMGRRSIAGWYSGASIDSQETLTFSALNGVRSMNEMYPLEKVNDAYERMIGGRARFRVVLTMRD
jgi:alcohol dehydrogenase/propanol-preferring alcohol dehydrogenase